MAMHKILVPLDGSAFAEWALLPALSLATSLGACIELVSVYDDQPTVGGWPLASTDVSAWFRKYHSDLVSRISERLELPLQTFVESGPVARTLESVASDNASDLIVMSTHGRGSLSRAWLGSVADHVARHVQVPILLVRPEAGAPDLADRPRFRRILIALDGSERAEASLDAAMLIGKPFKATYRLVRVVPPHYAVSPYLPHTIAETRAAIEEEQAEAKRYLGAMETALRQRGVDVEIVIPVGVNSATGILHTARDGLVDMIVIASHGRGALGKVLLGSVADKVLRGSDLPVLLVRQAAQH